MDDHGVKGFWVGDWLVEPELSRVTRGDDVEHIEPRSMAVLECLVAHPREVLPKERLIKAVWGEAFVGDEVLTHAIWELRRAFGDDARSPTYIQTIPKRGYRLRAKVRPLGPPPEPLRPGLPASTWIAVTLAAALAVLSAVWFLEKPNPTPTADPESTQPARPRLLVTLQAENADNPELRLVLNAVRSELSGIDDFEIIVQDDPGRWPFTQRDHGLELSPAPAGSNRNIAYRLYSLSPRSDVYGDTLAYGGDNGVGDLADNLAETIKQFSQINTNELYHEAHIKPWIDLKRHEWSAIQRFLRAARRTLDWEFGYASAYAEAAEIDHDFLAPLIWGSSACMGDTDESAAAYVARLERLERGSSDFESAVARYKLSSLARDLLEARRSLVEALEEAPNNGPILVNLAALESSSGDGGTHRALDVLQPLIKQRWRYPSVYPQAASYALELRLFNNARDILEVGQSMQPDAIDTLALLEALALVAGQPRQASNYRERFERRLEMLKAGEESILVVPAYRTIIEHARATRGLAVVEALETRLEQISGKTN